MFYLIFALFSVIMSFALFSVIKPKVNKEQKNVGNKNGGGGGRGAVLIAFFKYYI